MKKSLWNNILFYFIMCLTIFLIGGTVYYTIEILYRGYSHISMFILAGLISITIALMNDFCYSFETDYIIQVITAAIIATIGEGFTGILVNIILKLNVWDYSGLWGNFFFGQCNIFYCMAWIIICFFGIPILDTIEWKCFNGQRPYYKICGKVFFRC